MDYLASIIVPVLDEREAIAKNLPLLQPLRREGFEIIVVDGGSSDGSLEEARPHADLALSSSRGRASQMNAGANHARSNWFFFLHIDTTLPENFLSVISPLSCAQSCWGFFSLRLDGGHWLLRVIERMISWRSRLSGIGTGDQLLYCDRQSFESIGGFSEIPLMEDVEFSKKMLAMRGRPRFICSSVTTSSRRWESNGMLRTVWLMWRIRWSYWRGASPTELHRQYYP